MSSALLLGTIRNSAYDKPAFDPAITVHCLIAPSSFKGSLTSREAAACIAEGIRKRIADVGTTLCPVADGGEGTLDVFVGHDDFTLRHSVVRGPLRHKVEARWGTINRGKTAIIESAECIGLPLISASQRNPCRTSSHGLGDAMVFALHEGCTELIIGLGGSATNDCGVGMLEALGIVQPFENEWDTCAALERLPAIDLQRMHDLFHNVSLTVLADVRNPLTGIQGATHVFGKQKGADDAMILKLESVINVFAQHVREYKPSLTVEAEGTGAAGGLGFALALCGGTLTRGAEKLLDFVSFDALCESVDVVITGEGRIDSQTYQGKAVQEVARRANNCGKPVIAFAGKVENGLDAAAKRLGLKAIIEFATNLHEEDAMRRANELLVEASFNYSAFLIESIKVRTQKAD